MSFGFSAGDFLAVGRLAKDIISCLQDVGGAKSDYQELIRELECLQRAVQHLDKLQNKAPSTNLDSIKYAALICWQPLEEFLRKIRKYEKSLGVWAKEGTFKTAVDKIRFGFGHKEEICKLQNYLNIHVGIINVTLAEYGLEKMDIATNEATAERLQIRERLEDTRSMITKIGDNLSLQTLVVQNTHNMLSRLFQTLTGELKTSWTALADMVAKVFVSTQQTHVVVQEIRSSLTDTFTRMPYFQDPLMIEDALGFKFPFPAEYDFDLLEVIIKRRFINGPGSLEVEAGNYEFIQTRNSNNVLSKSSRLLPGMAITMAIIIVRPTLTDETCPMPGCSSRETTSRRCGGRVCSSCGVWFSTTEKSRNTLSHLLAEISAMLKEEAVEERSDTEERPPKRIKLELKPIHVQEDVALFRNVRLSDHEFSKEEALRIERTTDLSRHLAINHAEEVVEIFSPTKPSASQELQELGLGRKRRRSHTSRLPQDSPDQQFRKSNSSVQANKAETQSHNINRSARGPVEFSEASLYVSAVKNRYSATPKVYKQFLETLQTYQREHRSILEVYDVLVRLFNNEPDLVEGLEKFIPKSSRQNISETQMVSMDMSASENSPTSRAIED